LSASAYGGGKRGVAFSGRQPASKTKHALAASDWQLANQGESWYLLKAVGTTLQQIQNCLQHPRKITPFCDNLQHLVTSQQWERQQIPGIGT
jgi:hypothetical protein